MAFNDLYQDIILDHYKHPRNFGEGSENAVEVELDNPTCGDHIKLMMELDEKGIVRDLKFSGSGCAISVASASMMTEEVLGKSLAEAKKIVQDVLATLTGKKDEEVLDEHGDLTALRGVAKFPVRVKCATLSWHAVQKALEAKQAKD